MALAEWCCADRASSSGRPPPVSHASERDAQTRRIRKTRKVRVLLVDDEPQFLAGLQRVLKRKSIECRLALSGQEAVDIIQTDHDFDAALLDMRMPGMDGLQTMHALKALLPSLPVGFCTGGGWASERLKEVADGGGQFVLRKPVEPQVLVDAIVSLCHPERSGEPRSAGTPTTLGTAATRDRGRPAPRGGPGAGTPGA